MAYYDTPEGEAKEERLRKYKERMALAKARESAKKGKPKPKKKKAENVATEVTKRKKQVGKIMKAFGLGSDKKKK
jgi:hypothetical protein